MVDTETASALPRLSGLSGAASDRVSTIERVVVYIGVFLVPFANLRMPQVFFTLSDLFFCLSLFILVVSGRLPNKPLEGATTTWLLAFTLLFVGLMASSILRGTAERGLIVTVQYLFSYLILLVVLVRKDSREAHRLAVIFLAAMVVVDIHGIFTFYTVGYVPSGSQYRDGIAFVILIAILLVKPSGLFGRHVAEKV